MESTGVGGNVRDIGEGFVATLQKWAIAVAVIVATLIGLLVWKW